MEALKRINTSSSTFTLRNDGIILSEPNSGFEGKIDLHKAIESVNALSEMCNDCPRPILAHMGDSAITDEAREYFFENVHVSAAALVANTFVARMMANLIINFKKPSIPIKLFKNEEDAVAWIYEVNPLLNKSMVA